MCTEKKLEFEQVKNKALRYLEYRAHSEHELYVKLKRAGAEEEDIERVLEFLREYRFVDDKEFALKCARDMKNLKKLLVLSFSVMFGLTMAACDGNAEDSNSNSSDTTSSEVWSEGKRDEKAFMNRDKLPE